MDKIVQFTYEGAQRQQKNTQRTSAFASALCVLEIRYGERLLCLVCFSSSNQISYFSQQS